MIDDTESPAAAPEAGPPKKKSKAATAKSERTNAAAKKKRSAEAESALESVAESKPKKSASKRSRRTPFEVAGHTISAGKRMRIELPIGNLMSGTPVALPLIVVHGKTDGPVVWLSAAIHGDEICGVEIIRQVLDEISAKTMSGTVIAAPVVNVHGFNTNDRYLPDRRDLNRSFPGSARGSLASRIADLFMREVVTRSDVGIDLHTGSDLRTNLPQIRCDLDHGPTLELANTFGAPIVIDARLRDGSLRQAAVEAGKIMLLFEGGEASRFDPAAIAAGKAGVLRTLNHLGLTQVEVSPSAPCLYSRATSWSRASKSGIVHLDARLRDGSLRQAAVEAGKIMLLFEGGEASRFDPAAIAAGKAGVLRTLNHLGLTQVEVSPSAPCLYSRATSWSRASKSGIVHLDARLGELVRAKDRIATIYDPYGKALGRITSRYDGIVIGHTQAPLVNHGDAISHVARILPEPPTPGWGIPGAIDPEAS